MALMMVSQDLTVAEQVEEPEKRHCLPGFGGFLHEAVISAFQS